MNIKLTFSKRQADGIVRNLFAKDADAVAAMRAETVASAERVRARTEQLCPKDSHFMSENIEKRFSPDQLTYEVGWEEENFIVNAPTHRFYPPYVELGTERQGAQPSLGPAFEEEREIYSRNLRQAIKAALARRAEQL